MGTTDACILAAMRRGMPAGKWKLEKGKWKTATRNLQLKFDIPRTWPKATKGEKGLGTLGHQLSMRETSGTAEDCAQPVNGNCFCNMAIAAANGLGFQERVVDSLFGGVDGGLKQR